MRAVKRRMPEAPPARKGISPGRLAAGAALRYTAREPGDAGFGERPAMSETPPSLVPASAVRKARRAGCLQGCLVGAALLVLSVAVVPAVLVAIGGAAAADAFRSKSAGDDDAFSGDASGLREVFIGSREPVAADDAAKASDDGDAAAKAADDEGDLAAYKAVRIPLYGTIDLGGDAFGEEGATETALRSIRRATEDPSVDAILLLVDSGGGGITASDILYDALCQFRHSGEGRRIVALMGDMACSGAYYASLPADRIIAHPTTMSGSIGVILPSYSARRLADRLGIADASIQSGENKAMLHPLRDLTEEQRTMLQEVVDELHGRFTSLVARHRPIAPERVKAIADGRIYTARQALGLHLVDGIGYLADAEDAVARLLGGDRPVDFYEYEHKLSLRDLLATPSFWGAVLRRAVPVAEAPVPARTQAR